MIAEQSIANLGNGVTLGVVSGLDYKIALSVDRHGAVVQVGRANPKQPVIDHHDLGMDHRIDRVPAVVHGRVDEPDAISAGPPESSQEMAASVTHRFRHDPRVISSR